MNIIKMSLHGLLCIGILQRNRTNRKYLCVCVRCIYLCLYTREIQFHIYLKELAENQVDDKEIL